MYFEDQIDPQAWKHGTDWQWQQGKGEGDNGGKKGKGIDKEHVWVTHILGQQCANWPWEQRSGWMEEGWWGKIVTALIE